MVPVTPTSLSVGTLSISGPTGKPVAPEVGAVVGVVFSATAGATVSTTVVPPHA